MPTIRTSVPWRVILPLFFLGCAIAPASAHFLLNLNVRILHVEHLADGLKVYLRTPMPYLVADRVGPVGADGLPEPAPYTTNRMEEGKLVHYVDHGQLRRHIIGLGVLAAEGFRFDADGKPHATSVVCTLPKGGYRAHHESASSLLISGFKVRVLVRPPFFRNKNNNLWGNRASGHEPLFLIAIIRTGLTARRRWADRTVSRP